MKNLCSCTAVLITAIVMGRLREMFCEAGSGIPLEFGEEILELDQFSAEMDGKLLSVRLKMTDGTVEDIFLHLRSEQEAAQ